MIYISLGSNLGNRINNLWLAVNLLTKRCLQDVRCSIVLETEAILPEGVPVTWNKPFLNMIISGKSLNFDNEKKADNSVSCVPSDTKIAPPEVIDLFYNLILLDSGNTKYS